MGQNSGKICSMCGKKFDILLPVLPNLQIHIIPDADHVFSGKLDEFIELPKKYLFA